MKEGGGEQSDKKQRPRRDLILLRRPEGIFLFDLRRCSCFLTKYFTLYCIQTSLSWFLKLEKKDGEAFRPGLPP